MTDVNDTTSCASSTATLTIDKILGVVKTLEDNDLIIQYMKEQGCDPKDGWVMVIPHRVDINHKCVVQSPYLFDKVIMMKRPSFWGNQLCQV